jgi:hypothetical protein
MLQIISWIQPEYDTCRDTAPRDVFRSIAREFHDFRISLRKLSIPHESFRSLVKLLLSQQLLGDGQVEAFIRPMDLDAVADSVVKAFTHDSNKPITWQNFDEAYVHTAVS